MTIEHFQKVYDLVKESEKFGPLVKGNELTGTSSDALIGTLQRISKYQEDTNDGLYLEIGVYQGLSLIPVGMVLPDIPVYGIDNFAQNDPESKNKSIFGTKECGTNPISWSLIITSDKFFPRLTR